MTGPGAHPVTWGGLRSTVPWCTGPDRPAPHVAPADVAFRIGGTPVEGAAVITEAGTAVVSRDGRRVRFDPDGLDRDRLPSFCAGMLTVELLARRGRPALHGSAVGLGGRAVAIVGPSGAGKSTLAVSLGNVLADDLCALHQDEPGWSVGLDDGPVRLRVDSLTRLGLRAPADQRPSSADPAAPKVTIHRPPAEQRRLRLGAVVVLVDGDNPTRLVLEQLIAPPSGPRTALAARAGAVAAAAASVPVLVVGPRPDPDQVRDGLGRAWTTPAAA